jgi:small subunit ribosomal protein S17
MSKRIKTGVAHSCKMDKTVIISVHTYKRHPKYMKRYRTTKKFYAHDEQNEVREGDIVTITETRPLSKLKRWTVIEIDPQHLNEDDSSAKEEALDIEETSSEEIVAEVVSD